MNETPKNSPPAPKAPLIRLGDALGDFRSDADAAHEARVSGIPRGPVTGLPLIDREIGHALAVGVHGIHGAPGTGKTALALQVAAACRFPALFVTCEMAPAELLRRFTASATGTFLGRFKSGEMTGGEAEALAMKAIATAPDLYLLDATRLAVSLEHIKHCGDIAQGDSKGLLIVIDSLHSWAEGLGGQALNEYESLNSAIQSLRMFAQDIKQPILFTSERNRESMKSDGQNSGAGTRKIEYSSETIFSLDVDKDDLEDSAGERKIIVTLAKNRNGSPRKKIPLMFNGALQRFRQFSTEEAVGQASAQHGARNDYRGQRNI